MAVKTKVKLPSERAVKKAIENYEYYKNHFHKLTGHSVRAADIEFDPELEDNPDKVTATVYVYICEEERQTAERYPNAEYSLAHLKKGGWLK